MRVLMSGGTGFIGRTFLEGLRPSRKVAPLHLTLLSRAPQAFATRHPECVPSQSDIKIRFLERTLPKIDLDEPFDVVIHGAEIPGPHLTATKVMNNDAALRAMLRLAKRAGAKRFVYLSSGAVYTLDPSLRTPFDVQTDFPNASPEIGAYAWSKYQSEREVRRACEAAGIAYVILRIFNVASPHVPLQGRYALGNFVSDLLDDTKATISIHGSGRDRRSFISGYHLAGLLCHSLNEAPDDVIYNVCSNDELSILELANLVCHAAGRNKPVTVTMPDAPFRHYTGAPNLPDDFLSTRENIRNEIARFVAARSVEASFG